MVCQTLSVSPDFLLILLSYHLLKSHNFARIYIKWRLGTFISIKTLLLSTLSTFNFAKVQHLRWANEEVSTGVERVKSYANHQHQVQSSALPVHDTTQDDFSERHQVNKKIEQTSHSVVSDIQQSHCWG